MHEVSIYFPNNSMGTEEQLI